MGPCRTSPTPSTPMTPETPLHPAPGPLGCRWGSEEQPWWGGPSEGWMRALVTGLCRQPPQLSNLDAASTVVFLSCSSSHRTAPGLSAPPVPPGRKPGRSASLGPLCSPLPDSLASSLAPWPRPGSLMPLAGLPNLVLPTDAVLWGKLLEPMPRWKRRISFFF